MRKIATLLIFLALRSFSLIGQNSQGQLDDIGRIAITSFISQDSNIPSTAVQRKMKNLLNQIVTKNGLAATKNERFVITSNIEVEEENILNANMTMYQYTLNTHFYIGDGREGTLFSHISKVVKGVGETKSAAFTNAIGKINGSDPEFQGFVAKGKQRIVEYFNTNIDFILAEAEAYKRQQQYDRAIYTLFQVPTICRDAYMRALAAADVVYQEKINYEAAQKLQQANAIWDASQDDIAAQQVGEILATIDPAVDCTEQVNALWNKIAAHRLSMARSIWSADHSKESAQKAAEYLGRIPAHSSSNTGAEQLNAEIAKHFADLDRRDREDFLRLQERAWMVEDRNFARQVDKDNKEYERTIALDKLEHEVKLEEAKHSGERLNAMEKISMSVLENLPSVIFSTPWWL